jgi:hypothetical protein
MKEYKIMVRPLKPEWFKGEDLDSLVRIHTFNFKEHCELIGYLRGWIDSGFIIMGIDEVEE